MDYFRIPSGANMNSIRYIRVLFISLVLFSCSSPTASPNFNPTPEGTKFPASPVQPTMMVTLSTTKAADTNLPEGCSDLVSISADPSKLEGLLYIRDGLDYHLFDPKTKQLMGPNGENTQPFNGIISPNKKYILALISTEEHERSYILRTVDQEIKSSILIPAKWIGDKWLDNEHVSFHNLLKPNEVIIWNPFTGDQKSIPVSLPSPETVQIGPNGTLVYFDIDPTLKRVLFGDQNEHLILWDLESQKEMASLPAPAQAGGFLPSQWSPDGKAFATSWPFTKQANELYVFHMSGNLTAITNLNEKYAFANTGAPVWSPDGHHIGFWVTISDDANVDPEELRQWLAILDTTTLETQIYCLPFSKPSLPAFPIVWGPDGQQLIANTRSSNGDMKPTLVDLKEQTQSILDTGGMFVEGWMTP